MAAHLARHTNAVHGSKSRRPLARKKTAKRLSKPKARGAHLKGVHRRKKVGRPPAIPGVVSWSLGEGVGRLVGDMQTCCDQLAAQREKLDAQIAVVNNAMAAMQGVSVAAPAPRRRGRPVGSGGREGSLKSYMVKILRQRSRPMSPRDIAARIVKAGYKSKAKDLTKAVSNALPQLRGVKKVGFGMYKMG